jgi:hypothetical protein
MGEQAGAAKSGFAHVMTARMVNAIVATTPKNVSLAFGAICPLLTISLCRTLRGEIARDV